MAEYIGRRIVPTHGGVWNETKEYEELTIVLDEESGDSYISRIPVPSGTALDDEKYWMLFSIYNEQIQEALDAIEETSEELKEYVDNTATSLTEYVQETAEDLTTQVEAATKLTESNTEELNDRMDTLESRQDANVTASTDSDADYAAEVVDARVNFAGTEYASLGTHIRTMEEQLAGSHVMYLSNDGSAAFSLDIDVDGGTYEGTVQVTSTRIVGVTENRKYILVYPMDEPVELNSPDSSNISEMRIFGYDASAKTFNMFLTDEFQALGSNGYYIAAWWKEKFYNSHIHPDVRITYNGTEYSAGELTDTDSASYLESRYAEQIAGTHTMYLSSKDSGALSLDVDVDGGTYEGTIQVTTKIIGVTENQKYILIPVNDEAVELNVPNSSNAGEMRILGYDAGTKTINLFLTGEFQELGEDGYYIASWYKQMLFNPHIDPDFKFTYNGTEYSAGDLFYTNTGSFVPQPYKDYVDYYDAGTHTMYLSDYSSGALTIDTDEGTIQVTKRVLGVTEDRIYIFVAAADEPIDLISNGSGMSVFGYDAGTETFNMYQTAAFRALGQNGYYIASWWKGKFYNAHMHPDFKITYNGTEYSAGELFDTESASYVEARYAEEFAGSHTMYLSSANSASFSLDVDVSGGTYEGTVQITSANMVGVTENRKYIMIYPTDEAVTLNSPNSSNIPEMRIFGYDATTKAFNLFLTDEFKALGGNGYYIASWWKEKFFNPHMDPDLKITYNGTEYSAGDLFYTNTGSFVPQPYKDYVADYTAGDTDEDDLGDIVSPSHWDCMEGRQFSMFFDCLSRHEGRMNLYRIVNSMGLERNEYCLNYTPASDDENFSVTIRRLNENTMETAETKSVAVKVHHPLSASITKNVCICGDSLVDNKYLAQEVWDLLDEDGDCVINHIGTRGGTGYEHEGRGGWTWARYLQDYTDSSGRSNAFWDSDNERLDFQKYCENNGYEGIDYFLIALGTNDVSQGTTLYNCEDDVQKFIDYAKEFIDALLDEETGFPDCKVGIGLCGPGADYAFTVNNSMAIFRRSINTLNLALIKNFDDGAYHENVTCFAHGLRTNRKYAFAYTDSAINDRYSETCRAVTNLVHPTQRGYQAWADGYYCQIRAWLEEDAEEVAQG